MVDQTGITACSSAKIWLESFPVELANRWPSSPNSDVMVKQVPVHVRQAVVPEEDTVLQRYLLHPLHRHLDDLKKMTKELVIDLSSLRAGSTKAQLADGTYLLPMGACRGLMSAALNAAKKSSTGLAEYEYGPVYSTGTPSSSKTFMVVVHVWYEALSSMMTVFLCQYCLS